jgi:hypothetical protein
VLITTPLLTLLFGITGIIWALWTWRPLGRWATLTLLAWLLVPITRSSLPGVLNYDVIRRFIEFTPALSIFAGIGGASLMEWMTRTTRFPFHRWKWIGSVAIIAVFLSPVTAIWRYFPYETSYYNPLVGGLGGAQSLKLHQSTDYWLSSYREGINWINDHADQDSVLIIRHDPHFVPSYPIRKDLVVSRHLWMDELLAEGRPVYLMYVPAAPYDYNMCLAEAFLRPQHEIWRDGGLILRIYKLTAESGVSVVRDAFPPPQRFSVSRERRWVTLSWEPSPVPDVVGYIIYYGGEPRQYQGAACFREERNQVRIFAGLVTGTYYVSMSVLTRQGQESERTPDIRRELRD